MCNQVHSLGTLTQRAPGFLGGSISRVLPGAEAGVQGTSSRELQLQHTGEPFDGAPHLRWNLHLKKPGRKYAPGCELRKGAVHRETCPQP